MLSSDSLDVAKRATGKPAVKRSSRATPDRKNLSMRHRDAAAHDA